MIYIHFDFSTYFTRIFIGLDFLCGDHFITHDQIIEVLFSDVTRLMVIYEYQLNRNFRNRLKHINLGTFLKKEAILFYG